MTHEILSAADTQSLPYVFGYLFGALFGIALLIGAFVFAVIAMVKAFTRRTTGWIVTGIISGSLVLLVVGVFALAVLGGLMSHVATGARRAPVATPVASDDWRAVYGRDMVYGIEMPPGWEVSSIENTFLRIGLFEQGMFIEIMADRGNVGSPEKVWEIYAPGKKDRGTTDPVPVTLDGRRWLRFTEDQQHGNATQKVKVKCEMYVYAGPEGSYVIKCATPPNVFDTSLPRLREVVKTFTFPAPKENI